MLLHVTALLLLLTQRPPVAPDAPPARVVRSVAFAPAAGNGVAPVAGVVDPASQRLYTLNRASRSVSVVNLRRRRVLATVPLPPDVELGYYTRFMLDAGARRLLLATRGPVTRYEALVIAVDTAACNVAATRRVQGLMLSGAALDTTGHRLCLLGFSGPGRRNWHVEAIETRTLQTRSRFDVPDETPAIAVAGRSGVVLLAEPVGEVQYGRRPQECRVVARRLSDGAALAQSDATFEFVEYLVPDEGHGRVAVCHGTGRINYAAYVAVLGLARLDVQRELTFEPGVPAGSPPVSTFVDPVLDPVHGRLVVYLNSWSHRRGIGVVDLSGRAGPRTVAPGLAEGSGRLLLGLASGGTEALVSSGNGVHAHDLRNGRLAWRVALGALFQGAFLDRARHRVLAAVVTDESWLALVHGTTVRRLPYVPGPLAAADFGHGWLYYTLGTIWGGGGYLERVSIEPPRGRSLSWSSPAHMLSIVFGRQPGRSYRLFFPPATDVTEPKAYLCTYDGDRQVARKEVGAMPAGLYYLPARDAVYVVRDGLLEPLGGGAPLRLPRSPSTRPPGAPDYRPQPFDADTAGRFLYYADPGSRLLYRLRLPDGSVAAARRLPFAASWLGVDDGAGVIHLLDPDAGRLVTVRTF